MELLEILKNAQAFGLSPPDIIVLYFLYRVDKTMGVMKTTSEVLTDTLIKMIPGFRRTHDETTEERAVKSIKKGAIS